MNTKTTTIIACLILTTTGCATKMYGKQAELTSLEKNTLNCREIQLEVAKVNGFKDYVHKESKFDWKDAAAIFGDLYIGNYMEKKSALKSADARLAQLTQLSEKNQCSAT